MRKFWLRLMIFLATLSISLLAIGWESYKVAFGEPIDIFEEGLADAGQLKAGLSIHSMMPALLGSFGTEEVTTTKGGNAEGEKKFYDYYILPIKVGNETYFVAFQVNAKSGMNEVYEDIAARTMASSASGMVGESTRKITISGGLVSLDKDIYHFMQQWFILTKWFDSEEELQKYVLPLVFKPINVEGTKTMLWFALGMGAFAIIVFICVFGNGKKASTKRLKLKFLGKGVVRIDGVRYDAKRMVSINNSILSGDIEKAKRELITVYKATDEEADIIIKKWKKIH